MLDKVDTKGELVICTVAMPADTNANGDIFGGWLVSNMDMGGGSISGRLSRSRVVTVAIESMTFIKPVFIGDTVYIYAELLKIGNTSMQFKMHAWTLTINDEQPKKVAEGVFIFVAIDEQGKPQPVHR